MRYDPDAVIRLMTGTGRDGDFEKVAVVGSALLRGAKWVGQKMLTSPVRTKAKAGRPWGRKIKSKPWLAGGAKPGRRVDPIKGLLVGGSLYGGVQAGRSASVQPAGYNPNAAYYKPGVRVR